MFSAFVNAFKVKELKSRILFTLGVIALCRLAALIPCPGVDTLALNEYMKKFNADLGAGDNMVFGLFGMFTGGAMENFAVATLGIMPYISASIIMQMLMPVIPQLERMMKEGGESGRQKYNQYTRYLTVAICVVQGAMAAWAMANPSRIGLPAPVRPLVLFNNTLFVLMTIVVLTCGTMFLMWLGERVTEKGIGNGASIIITIGILSRFPAAIYQLYDLVRTGGGSGHVIRPAHLFLLALLFVAVTAFTIILTQGQRRVPIQYARSAAGGRRGAQPNSSYIPLKVNFSGVMPIILAGAILMVPGILFQYVPWLQWLAPAFVYGSPAYMLIYGALILLFAFFWVGNQFNPIQISESLRRDGAFIPGIRPGKPTAEFLDASMTRITVAGSLLLVALTLFPMILTREFNIPAMVGSFFGGTSLLIMVGVVLDTLSQLEAHLIMRNYDGFLKHGRIMGRRGRSPA